MASVLIVAHGRAWPDPAGQGVSGECAAEVIPIAGVDTRAEMRCQHGQGDPGKGVGHVVDAQVDRGEDDAQEPEGGYATVEPAGTVPPDENQRDDAYGRVQAREAVPR